jgi:hypothetical protein
MKQRKLSLKNLRKETLPLGSGKVYETIEMKQIHETSEMEYMKQWK